VFLEIILPLFLVLVFTYQRCRIDIHQAAKVRKEACSSGEFFLYVTIAITGNSVATFLASNLLSQKFAPGLVALCSAFLGVFAFQGVLSNTNITLFGKKALTFEEWMTKAQDNAIAKANAQEVQLVNIERLAAAHELRQLSEADFNTYVAYYLDENAIAQLTVKAQALQTDPILYKALALVSNRPEDVRAILETIRARRI